MTYGFNSALVKRFADGGTVPHPASLAGIVGGIAGLRDRISMAAGDVVDKFRPPAGYKPAAQERTAPPAMQPAPAQTNTQVGGMQLDVIRRREAAAGLKDGGMVRGPGTGTSDSIRKLAAPGTYIMPADSTETIGADALAGLGVAGLASAGAGRWSRFSPDSGTLGIPRADMPQIASSHRGALVNFLQARGITHAIEEEVPASSLKPTQAEFSPSKVKGARERASDRAILVSADGHVLDGHHQWMAKLDAGEPVRVIRLGAPVQDLLRLAHQFPSSTTAPGARSTTPKVGAAGGDKVPVRLSNGEYELPPEQVHAIGVQALDAIKGSTHQPEGGVRGLVERSAAQRIAEAPTEGYGRRTELFFANGGVVRDDEALARSMGAQPPNTPAAAAQQAVGNPVPPGIGTRVLTDQPATIMKVGTLSEESRERFDSTPSYSTLGTRGLSARRQAELEQQRHATDTQAASSRYATDTQADTSRHNTNVVSGTSRYNTDVGSATQFGVAGLRDATERRLGDQQAATSRYVADQATARAGSVAPAGYRQRTDGRGLEFIPGGPADPSTPKGKNTLNETQAKSLSFGARMSGAGQNLDSLAAKGVDQPGLIHRAADAIGLGAATNWTQSPQQQQVEQSQRDFVNAILRRESGAAISDGEFSNAKRQYFPQPGDSVEVAAQKRQNRELATRGMLAEVPDANARLQSLNASQQPAESPQLTELRRRAASNPAIAARLRELGY